MRMVTLLSLFMWSIIISWGFTSGRASSAFSDTSLPRLTNDLTAVVYSHKQRKSTNEIKEISILLIFVVKMYSKIILSALIYFLLFYKMLTRFCLCLDTSGSKLSFFVLYKYRFFTKSLFFLLVGVLECKYNHLKYTWENQHVSTRTFNLGYHDYLMFCPRNKT